jgi:hypothetical protein
VLLFFYTDLADLFKYPVGWTNAIAGIKAERNDIPIDYKESYATTRSCGRSCDIVKIFYKGLHERLVVTAANYVSWADDAKRDKNTIIPGTNYYCQNKDGKQLLFWEDKKEELELGLEYTGEKLLSI